MRASIFFTLLSLLLTSCTSNSVVTPLPEVSIEIPLSVDATSAVATPSTSIPSTTNATVLNRPIWQTLPLTNARTGETFTFADFAGKTVFVEPMATWCPNCRQQLGHVSSVRAQLDADQFVFIALSVETNITADDLAQYAEDNGFDWLFAVSTPEMLSELTATFGRTITNSPSTPHFIIHPDGSTTGLTTGIESGSQLVEQLTAASGG